MREPDKSGVAKAWLINPNVKSINAHIKKFGYPPTGLRTWFINGPFHPFWSWWIVSVISLKDVPGVPPANKQYPEAEYEYTCYSLDGVPNIDELDKGNLKKRGFKSILQPADVQFHFHNVTDEQAIEICDAAVSHIVAGQSCDSDYRQYWKAMLARTVEHYVLGVH